MRVVTCRFAIGPSGPPTAFDHMSCTGTCFPLPASFTSRMIERQIRACLLERDVADLAALRRVPAEEVVRVRRVARADRVLDVGVGSRLAELVVEDRARVLPAFREDIDPVAGLREHADRVVDRLALPGGPSRGSRRARASSRRRRRPSRRRRRARRRAAGAWRTPSSRDRSRTRRASRRALRSCRGRRGSVPVPSRIREGSNAVVGLPSGKYCAMTLFSCASSIAAGSAQSSCWMSSGCQAAEPPR